MTPSTRIVVNTIAQYVRTIINALLMLYATRLILDTLGDIDYGIYALVAGVVSMLAFITNAMTVTTQRYMSFYQGTKDMRKMKVVFGNSLLLHLGLGIVIGLCLLAITPLLFDGFLNIPAERIDAARHVYYIVIVLLLCAFMASPYKALLVSHENIVYTSVVEVLDGVMKVVLVILLADSSYDKLTGYAYLMLAVQVFNFLALSVYSYVKYEECIVPGFRMLDGKIIREISSFAVWTIYSVGCITGRTQGIAVCLNKWFGAAINTAYGLAFQVSGIVNVVSSSMLNAVNPQIVRAEGEQNRRKMLQLSTRACKWSYLLLATVAIPAMYEMPSLLSLWLKEVPENATLFCRMVLLASLIDATTRSLGTANQAVGRIRNYSIIINSLKLLALPAALLCLACSLPLVWVAVCYVASELICSVFRIPFLHATAGLDMAGFIRQVYLKIIIPTAVIILFCSIYTNIDIPYRWVTTFIVAAAISLVMVYTCALEADERQFIKDRLHIKHS